MTVLCYHSVEPHWNSPLAVTPDPLPMALLCALAGIGLAPLLAVAFSVVDEVAAPGTITEAFACGTAAVVTPIAELRGDGFTIGSPTTGAGELTMSLREELTDIQYGRRPDPHGWMVRLTDPTPSAE